MSTPKSFQEILDQFQKQLILGETLKRRYETALQMFSHRSSEYVTQARAGASKEDLDKLRNEILAFVEASLDVVDEMAFAAKKP